MIKMIKEHIKEFFSLGLKKYIQKYLLSNRGTKQTILKNTFWMLLTEIVDKGLKFALNILLARYLGVDIYGKFNFAFAFTAIFVILDDFGLASLNVRETAKFRHDSEDRVRTYVSNAMVLKYILTAVTLIISYSVIFIAIHDTFDKYLLLVFTLYSITFNYNLFFYGMYYGYEKMEYYFKTHNVRIILYFSVTVVFLFISKNLIYIVAGQAAVGLIFIFVNYALTKKHFFKKLIKPRIKEMKHVLSETWPLALSLAFTTLYSRIDTVMLSFMKTDTDVGIYAASHRLIIVLQSVLYIIHHAIYPKFSSLYHQKNMPGYRNLLRKLLKYSLLLFPAFIVLSLSGKLVIYLIYGHEYMDSAIVFSILSWCVLVIFFNQFWANSLVIMNRQKLQTLSFGSGALLNIIINYFLIQRYSYIGAAAATLITEVLVTMMVYFFCSREVRFARLLKKE